MSKSPRPGPHIEYSVHPGVLMVQKNIAALKEKTGRSLEEWVALVQVQGPVTEEARRGWLKEKQGLGTNYAYWLAERSVGKGAEDGDPREYLAAAARYVEALYSGPKAALRPIHDALLARGVALGRDVRICPCQTIVPLYRMHVFAQIKPTTRTRIDLGLSLTPLLARKKKLPARLVDTGGFAKKDRITHRIPLAAVEEIDAEVERWLKTAYDVDA